MLVTETWFKTKSMAKIDGYKYFREDHNDCNNGGGVCIYIKDNLESTETLESQLRTKISEQIWQVFLKSHPKNTIFFFENNDSNFFYVANMLHL